MLKVLYSNDDIFASHPANHGKWSWGNELLFGFLTGKRGNGAYHDILPPFTKVLMRSYDNSKSWHLEIPNVDFACSKTPDQSPNFDLSKSTIRVCGGYDTGGDDCVKSGGFYLSKDRGKEWSGPYLFDGLGHLFSGFYMNTSRTCQLQGENLVFLSYRKTKRWGSDKTVCCSHDGEKFSLVSYVVDDDNRAVMPSVVRATEKIVFCALRRKGKDYRNSIEIFKSVDNCKTWTSVINQYTGEANGNPPALLMLDNILYLCYANRSRSSLCCLMSIDFGKTWKLNTVDPNIGTDIGYPVIFGNQERGPICIYYADGKIWQREF